MRQFILSEISRLAAQSGGVAPGQKLFARETGIAEHQWRGRYWSRWGDALGEAGFGPNSWVGKHDTGHLLSGVIEACRHLGKLPTDAELQIYRVGRSSAPSPQTLRRHFGGRAGLIAALSGHVAGDANYADIEAMLPDVPPPEPLTASSPTAPSRDGFVYLIRSGDFFKIGRSDDIERRVKEIRVALPDKAELVHTIRTDDPSGIESYWHQRFKDRRANGEWFKLSAADVSAFKKRKFQ
ncbi:GIY-YIG nuclease family protein [Xanthobacter versatilis]|uniref:GIY-YIG nuclease family protein n=1 Tax=Xanthobacter autotrophicus (strain ATCC BAA-1158 / Py2) TaxID=78245 RepID=UPI00372896DD